MSLELEREEASDMCQTNQKMKMEFEQDKERKDEVKRVQKTTRNFYNLDMDLDKIVQGAEHTVGIVKQRFGLSHDQ